MITKATLPVLKYRRLRDGGCVEPIRPVLLCPDCHATYSADPGDYWNLPEYHVFRCEDCPDPSDDNGKGCPLVLARERRVFVPWGKADGELTAFLDAVWNSAE